jgi:hypothetical protein
VSSSEERKKRSFVERHGLWNDEQFEAAANADKCIEERGLEVVRLSFPDQHGVLRGKTVVETDGARSTGSADQCLRRRVSFGKPLGQTATPSRLIRQSIKNSPLRSRA